MKNIINLTWHNLIFLNNEDRIIVPPSWEIRISSIVIEKEKWIDYDGKEIKLYKTKSYLDESIIPKEDNILYIVSEIVAKHLKNRDDVLVTTNIIKQDNKIIWAKWLKFNPYFYWNW